jgi:hypothetical protein
MGTSWQHSSSTYEPDREVVSIERTIARDMTDCVIRVRRTLFLREQMTLTGKGLCLKRNIRSLTFHITRTPIPDFAVFHQVGRITYMLAFRGSNTGAELGPNGSKAAPAD